MNTQENNRLIAEFMGEKTITIDELKSILKENRENGLIHTPQAYVEDDLKYHSSWDWLMPVVDKIESDERFDVNVLQYGTIISSNTKERGHIEIVNNVANISFDSKIDHTYQAVVEFIKQHNNK